MELIRNRDIATLKNLWFVMRDAEELESKINWQRDRMTNVSNKVTGMPRGGTPKGMDELFATLDSLESEQKEMLYAYAKAYRDAEQIILAIPDRELRTLVRMEYVNQEPTFQIRKVLRLSEKRLRIIRECIEMADCMADVKLPDVNANKSGLDSNAP